MEGGREKWRGRGEERGREEKGEEGRERGRKGREGRLRVDEERGLVM